LSNWRENIILRFIDLARINSGAIYS